MSDSRHIALFLPSLNGGGAERNVLQLAGEFQRRHYRVTLLLGSQSGQWSQALPTGVEVVDFQQTRVISCLLPLMRYLRSQRPEVLLSTINHANIIALVARALVGGQTRVFVRESNTVLDVLAHEKNFKAQLIPWFMKHLYQRAEGVIAISAGVRRRLEAVVGQDLRMQVIHNPVIVPEMASLYEAASPIRLPAGRYLLAVGRLVPQKNFLLLIRAFARVSAVHSDLSLVIVGEGSQHDQLMHEIHKLNLQTKVVLTGFLHNPYPLYRGATLYCLSSSWEGFGNVIVEAMNCGVPVISTACAGGPEELILEGQNGMLSPVDDEVAFAQNILRGLDHPWNRSLIQAFASRFNLADIASKYLRFLGVSP